MAGIIPIYGLVVSVLISNQSSYDQILFCQPHPSRLRLGCGFIRSCGWLHHWNRRGCASTSNGAATKIGFWHDVDLIFAEILGMLWRPAHNWSQILKFDVQVCMVSLLRCH
ncbi:hypothetical protein M433DRAFT_452768 [Acidomyces richmondensis BFW]|nr:hypothetical protein M433DRAFT_452768 [Acidomyces richmondensis BFW]